MRMADDVRATLGPADPVRWVRIDVPATSALDLISRAESTAPAAPARRRSAPRLAVAIALTSVVVAGSAVASAPPARPASAATPVILDVEYPQAAPSAQRHLLAIADRIGGAPSDTSRGPVTYVRTRSWALDFAARGGMSWVAVIPWEQELWRASDFSGKRRTTWLSPQFSDASARRRWEHEGLATPRGTRVDVYGPAEQAADPSEPPSADVDVLADQIYRHHPRENGPKSAVRGVADMYRHWVLSREHRAAALRFLAGVDGLAYRGRIVDRAGRQGIAVTVDSGGIRDLLIIDPATGVVLGYEMLFLRRPSALRIRTPAVAHYVLVLEARRVGVVPW